MEAARFKVLLGKSPVETEKTHENYTLYPAEFQTSQIKVQSFTHYTDLPGYTKWSRSPGMKIVPSLIKTDQFFNICE